jgi:hypothetical protein
VRRSTRRLATDGARRSATAMTAREYASRASDSAALGGSATSGELTPPPSPQSER